jgi:dihydrolipoamide dehydrogenase
MTKLDVLIIGAGTAGSDAANTARRKAKSVGLVERGQVGGDCIFNACIPTKALVHAARTYKKMRSADFFGLPVLIQDVNYRNVKKFKDKIVSGIATGRDERLVKSGINLFRGDARFISPHEVAVGKETIMAEQIIITTGSYPAAPPIPGLKEAGFITNIEALKLEKVPARLAIIGGGPIGVEFAQIFSSFGSTVHIYEALERILINEDEEISNSLTGLFTKQGISVLPSIKIANIQKTGSGKSIQFQDASGAASTKEYDEILVATGRRPAIDNLDLPEAGVDTNKKGIVIDSSMRTSVPHIWAAGDVTGTYNFTFIAWEQGEVAALNATGDNQKKLDYTVLPRATFCDPEVASVGLTEKQAQEQGHRVKIGKFDYANLSRSIVANEMDGFIKIVAEEDSGRILGGHILGAEASSLIHELALAMRMGATISDVGNMFHAYPTLSEGVRYACQAIL